MEDDMLDITAPAIVQVEVDQRGVLWVNVDGICRLRICRAEQMFVDLPGRVSQRFFPRLRWHWLG